MKTKLKALKKLVAEAVLEAKVCASAKYLKKEITREKLQDIAVDLVGAGKITTEEELKGFFDDVDIAAKALKMIPLAVWQKMSSAKK